MNSITSTQFDFPRQTAVYNGKVRDVYTIADKYMVMVATDRIPSITTDVSKCECPDTQTAKSPPQSV